MKAIFIPLNEDLIQGNEPFFFESKTFTNHELMSTFADKYPQIIKNPAWIEIRDNHFLMQDTGCGRILVGYFFQDPRTDKK